MALSMDEQRMLAEIERRLAAEDPGLASNLTSFRKPGRLNVLRSTRARVVGSLFTVVVVAMVSLMVYAMLPFRSSARTTGNHPVTTSSTNSGPARIGAQPASSSSARAATGQTSASAQASSKASAVSKSSPSARSSQPAVAQSGGTSAAAVHSP